MGLGGTRGWASHAGSTREPEPVHRTGASGGPERKISAASDPWVAEAIGPFGTAGSNRRTTVPPAGTTSSRISPLRRSHPTSTGRPPASGETVVWGADGD